MGCEIIRGMDNDNLYNYTSYQGINIRQESNYLFS